MSSEKQFRNPTEYGAPKPDSATFTSTGAAACMLTGEKSEIKVECATLGKIIDYDQNDPNDMGRVMAPAAIDTLVTHFTETKRKPDYYDLIITGDLGAFGSRIMKDLLWEKGVDVEKQHVDCGELVYNLCESEYQGGSGAGCSSLVFSSFLYNKLKKKQYKKILLIATGALLSSVSAQQGESIPGIAHAVVVEG